MGGGLAADADGNIFVQTGNGTFDNTTDFGMSVLKLTPNNGSLRLADSYTPSNYRPSIDHDWDVSSGGLLLLPDQPGTNPHLMIGGGKEGTIYVMNRDNLGGYTGGQQQYRAVHRGCDQGIRCWGTTLQWHLEHAQLLQRQRIHFWSIRLSEDVYPEQRIAAHHGNLHQPRPSCADRPP